MSLLALGAACIGAACSAPAPPSPPARDTPAQDAAYPPTSTPTEAPSPSANEAPTTATPPDTTPAPPSATEPQETPVQQQPAPPPTSTPEPISPPAVQAGDAQPPTLTITMLSRGKGVPDDTRAAYKDIRALLEQQRAAYAVTGLRTQRIGLEGETRLCAEFQSAQAAQAALAEIRKRVASVDLLEISEAPCPSPKESKP